MRLYEFVVILRTSLTDAKRKKVIDQIKSLFKDAKVTKEDDLGQKPLAYRIKKELAGYYYSMQLESETGVAKGFEKTLTTNDDILRHLLIRRK